MTDTAKSQHKAILQINLEVMDILSTGELSGRPVRRDELAAYGLKPLIIRVVNGFDKNDCLTKLKTLIDSLETK